MAAVFLQTLEAQKSDFAMADDVILVISKSAIKGI